MERRIVEVTDGRRDGEIKERKDRDKEKRKNNWTRDGRTERCSCERTEGRRAGAADEQMDGQALQKMARETER